MNTTDLYKLPKDMLVKLVSTIQYQTREDVEKEHANQIREIFNEIDYYQSYSISYCCVDECDKYIVYDENGKTLYSSSEIFSCSDYENFTCCRDCFDYYCKDHTVNIRKINANFYCVKCFKIILQRFDSYDALNIE